MVARAVDEGVLGFLAARRSSKPALLTAPGPDMAELERMLTLAARVPDHKKLAPWRFVVIAGEERLALGDLVANACRAEEAEPPTEARLEMERQRLARAPVGVCVVSRPIVTTAVPEWEQVLSAGAAAFSLCLAANALGYGTAWITEWTAYSRGVAAALGLGESEKVVGFVYIGTALERQADRDRPALADVVSYWRAPTKPPAQ